MARLPSKSEILAWIAENPSKTAKRDIAKAFGIKGADRIDLKRILKELTAEGLMEDRRRREAEDGTLPPVSVLKVLEPGPDGDLFATPAQDKGHEGLTILLVPGAGDPALKEGDRALARLTPTPGGEQDYTARLIRRIGGSGAKTVLGVFRKGAEGGRVVPVDKGADREWIVRPGDVNGARDGELVEAQQAGPRDRMGLPRARISQRLGDPSAPRAVSLIAIHTHGIPDEFPPEVLAEAEAAEPVTLGDREDLRHLPLITIDPVDARDRDDAVLAQPDDDPKNPGGHVIWVAIADVAHYVRPGTALDREARKRGNSTYFPDRVVPMLPEKLSGDLCSLHGGVERPCMAVRMVVDAQGKARGHRFTRGLMHSPAALSYAQAQAAYEGHPDDMTAPITDTVIKPLFAAYRSCLLDRAERAPVDLDLPERRIVLDDEGHVTSVAFRERFDAHKLIEEFMIRANVCAAQTLEAKKTPLLYRVHEEPSPEKLDALREVAQGAGLTLAKGQVLKTRHLNQLLHKAAGTEHAETINMTVLRSMTQAYYAPQNFGHFGLNLRAYAHFTSPIRRYADLVVHRALIAAHGWGEERAEDEGLVRTGEHISQTERRSMLAERDTTDRYLAAFLADRVGNEFEGRISGIARFGIFVRLEESGADGLVPIGTIGREYFHYDPDGPSLKGSDTGLILTPGLPATVRLAEATPITGGLELELLSVNEKPLPRGKPGKGRSGGRKQARAKAKTRKIVKKSRRQR